MSRLANKTALITGGTSGIGLETAKQFIAEGARVAITGTNPKTIEAARAELGDEVLIIRADAADIAEQKVAAEAVEKAFGKLDIVFVNAGIAKLAPIETWTEEDFDRSMAINVKGPFFLIQALLPVLNNPASIVLNGSPRCTPNRAGSTCSSPSIEPQNSRSSNRTRRRRRRSRPASCVTSSRPRLTRFIPFSPTMAFSLRCRVLATLPSHSSRKQWRQARQSGHTPSNIPAPRPTSSTAPPSQSTRGPTARSRG